MPERERDARDIRRFRRDRGRGGVHHDQGDLGLGHQRGDRHRVGRVDDAGEELYVVASDQLLCQSLRHVRLRSGVVALDQLYLHTRWQVFLMLLHVERDAAVHELAGLRERAGIGVDDPDLDRLGERTRCGEGSDGNRRSDEFPRVHACPPVFREQRHCPSRCPDYAVNSRLLKGASIGTCRRP